MKLTKIHQRENGKFIDFNDLTQTICGQGERKGNATSAPMRQIVNGQRRQPTLAITYTNLGIIIESEGKVWSVYIHKVNRIMRFKDMVVMNFSKWTPAAIVDFSEPKIAQFHPSFPKNRPRTKHEIDRMTRC